MQQAKYYLYDNCAATVKTDQKWGGGFTSSHLIHMITLPLLQTV